MANYKIEMPLKVSIYFFVFIHSMYYDPFLAAAAANADPSYRLQVRIF